MASEAFSGTGNFSYTNSTSENQRVIINWMLARPYFNQGTTSRSIQSTIVLRWNNVQSPDTRIPGIYKNMETDVLLDQQYLNVRTVIVGFRGLSGLTGLPNEIMLAPGHTFTAECLSYNIVIIPEGLGENERPSEVISANSNPSYVNNTGKTVRVIINYMCAKTAVIAGRGSVPVVESPIILNWAGVSYRHPYEFLAKYFSYANPNAIWSSGNINDDPINNGFPAFPAPTDIFLRPGQSFSAICAQHNIVVVPE